MPDDSGRPDLTLVSEERAAREHASEPGEGAPSPPADPPTGLHYQDGTGLRLVALDLADAADGEILTKRTVEGKPTVVLEGVAAGIPAFVVEDGRGKAVGDLLVFDGASFVRVPRGASGELLSVRSDGTVGYVPAPSISVDAWEAKGNGEDDTTAFQTASKRVAELGGGTVTASDKEYTVDGLLWEAGVRWKGSSFRSGGGTRLKAKAASSNEGQIMIPAGIVNKAGWEDICFKPSGANTNQDCFYLHAQEPAGGGKGGVWESFFKNIEIQSGYRNCFWWRGGTANANCPHQFISFENVVGYRPSSGATALMSRAFKATGQCEKFETDARCSWNGSEGGTKVGTNWEIGREFLFSTTVTTGVAANASVITVGSTTGLEPGKKFSVGEGAFNEICQVESIAGNEVTLKAKLILSHSAGSNVYLLSGTVASPTTWAPSQWAIHSGALQNADLQILADACTDIHFYGTDFENSSRIIRRREKCLGVELHDVRVATASEGKTNGNGTVTNGSAAITGATGAWAEGDHIAGPGIPIGATVNKVEGTTLTLSAAVSSTGTGTAPVSVTLIKGGNGEGYIALNESGSIGVDTYFVEGAVDRTVVNSGGGARVRDVARNSGLSVVTSSGVTLVLAAANSLTIFNAYEAVLTSAAAAVKTLVSTHAPGERFTLRASVANAKVEEGGNLTVPGGVVTLAVGDAITFIRTDFGPTAWIAIGIYRAKEELEWHPVEGINSKLETVAGEAGEGFDDYQYAVDSFGQLHLRGTRKVKAAEELASGSALCAVPAGSGKVRPESKRDILVFSSEKYTPGTIAHNGSVTINSAQKAGAFVGFGSVPPQPIAG